MRFYGTLSMLEEGLSLNWVVRSQGGTEKEKNPQDLSVGTHIASLLACQRLFLERGHSPLACNEQWESYHHAVFLVGTMADWTDVISIM